ncbi:hypothetical protein Pint_26519 [Pistacia integerrima]|uniref:Uncharacterized protein n=1 Tax=Pistacia integerrima TaxID=434235 RepID=A0ACC0YGP1_9ROSI|nr:hypothetical protein Pint_26519 [Pistacia integerrima]
MEQQKHYPWEDQQQDEENDEALQLQGRQSRHRNSSNARIVVPTYNGHQEEVKEARAYSNHDELYKAAAGFAEEDKEGTISNELNHKKEEWDIQTSLTTEVRVSNQNVKILEDNEIISAIQVASREEEKTISSDVHLHNTNGSNVDADLIEEIDPELTEFDVEEVIKKQDTHDLVCPKCKSCITRTVILVRKKKPKFVVTIGGRNKTKPIRKPEAPLDVREDTEHTFSNVHPKTEPLIDKRKTEEDVYFRCLSCFSFFVPGVNFGNKDANRKEEAAGSESAGAKAYWPWSFFIPITNKKTGNRVSDHSDHIEEKNEGNKQPVRDFHVNSPQGHQGGLESIAPAQHIGQILPSETFDGSTPKNTVIPSKQKQDDAMVGNITGGDVILQVAPEPGSTAGVETREGEGWDILKSIVYGGLVELITSLGVVSSAAGAGATTLNIFAMGLANLVAGLFVLGHNLREMKNEQYGESPNQLNEEEGRYQKLLGRRGNFPLHASLAVISFLFFGLLPPVIYGFSFRESDNKDLKLAVVLGVSLICIILLVIAKCHVNKSPPKSYIKTILYYLSTGVVVSCVSYLAGELIDKLMEKLGWFDSTATSTLAISFIEASKPMESTWASF